LRFLREKRGWTQEDAADRIGLHFRHFQKIEYGKVNVTIDTLAKIGVAFGLNVADLLRRK